MSDFPDHPDAVVTRMNLYLDEARCGIAGVGFGGPLATLNRWPKGAPEPGTRCRASNGEVVEVLPYCTPHGLVWVQRPDGRKTGRRPDSLTPIPKTRTVTLEVEVPDDDHFDSLVVTRWTDATGEALPHSVTHIDGEEVQDED